MYNIFYLGTNQRLVDKWPNATAVDSIYQAQQESLTNMFWFVWNDTELVIDNLFYMHFPPENIFDNNINHVFLHNDNGEILNNSIWLLSKKIPLSEDEVNYRYVLNSKEWPKIVSTPKLYDKFIINTYDDYLNALNQSTTEMFWCVPNDVTIVDENIFNLTYTVKNVSDNFHDFDRKINHVFKNGTCYDGIVLCSTHSIITKREFDYRFIINKKEHDIVASVPQPYDIFSVSSYDEYVAAFENAKQDMFWIVPNGVTVCNDFDFSFTITHHNQYDRRINHVFLNGKYYDGVVLCTSYSKISQREFDYKFITNKKEHDIQASTPKPYDLFIVKDYNDYCKAKETTLTDFFYVVPEEVDVTCKFDYQISSHQKDNVHVFKNGNYHDGVFLIHKDKKIAQREFDYRFFTQKKEVGIEVSTPKPYDVVFISYQEPDADANYTRLLEKVPHARRVHGVKGIHQAHIEAAKLCNTPMVWIVDGDAQIVEDFDFDYQVPSWQYNHVHVWSSKNPVNGLVYGHGGVKLFPRLLTVNMDTSKLDMTTSISNKFIPMEQVSNITAFNVDEFSTWRGAFRECCKLASAVIDRQHQDETDIRLAAWCSATGRDHLFGDCAIQGARAGRKYGVANKGNIAALKKINDFEWLKEQFNLFSQQ